MAESKLPRLQPRMMATSRMETLVVREEEDVESLVQGDQRSDSRERPQK